MHDPIFYILARKSETSQSCDIEKEKKVDNINATEQQQSGLY